MTVLSFNKRISKKKLIIDSTVFLNNFQPQRRTMPGALWKPTIRSIYSSGCVANQTAQFSVVGR